MNSPHKMLWLIPTAALLIPVNPAPAQETLTPTKDSTAPSTKPYQIHITANHLDLLLLVTNGHLSQQNFGAPANLPIPTIDPTARRKPAPPEDAYPAAGDGYIWEPALLAIHADGNTSTDLLVTDVAQKQIDPDTHETRITLKDPQYPLTVTRVYRAYHDESILQEWSEIRHTESAPIVLQRFASAAPTFKPTADSTLTQFSGTYKREVQPLDEKLSTGTKILDSKLGSRAQYFQAPNFFLALQGPATENNGEVFGATLAWSGSFQFAFEIENNRLRALCGMNPYDSAYHLDPDKTFTTPAMLWSFSDSGKGQISRNFHRWARKYGIAGGDSPRPVLLNNWEATNTKFDETKLAALFDAAKEVGAESFLLDDGWFGNGSHARDNDRAGLGDWQPDAKKLPHGVEALADAAKSRGLRFGIWIEPEMVNPNSALYEKHPEWAITQSKRDPSLSRNQLVLDLTRPEVKEFVFHALDDLLTQNPGVSGIKWDCNRYITQPGSAYLAPDRQQNLWIDYTTALYDIMARINKNHPDVEMMVCAGGGGRVDYGSLPYFRTFWPSDNTDPVARLKIQYGFSQFFPAIATAAHVTRMGNRPMKFTYDVAMSGALGMDLDLSKLSPEDKKFLTSANAVYKSIRDIVTTGDLYRLESPYAEEGEISSRTSLAYVTPDSSRAILFTYQTHDASGDPSSIMIKGLDPTHTYLLKELNLPEGATSKFTDNGKTIIGAQILKDGITPPTRNTYDSSVIELQSVPAPAP